MSQDNGLAQEIINSHVRSLIANHLVDVETSDQHVVKPWFNGRTDFSPTVTDFADRGYPLTGGRLDYIDHRPVAVLIYHRRLHPINLYIWPAAGPSLSSSRTFSQQGYHLIHWSDGGMTYWAISDLNANELKDFADLVRKHTA